MTRKEFLTVAKATAREFGKDDIGYMAAALTYYVFFSIFPMILLGITLTGLFVDPTDASEFIFNNAARVAPGSVSLLTSALTEVIHNRESVGWVALVGVATLIFSASGAFDALDKAINRAWGAEQAPNFFLGKLTSFAMMAIIGVLLIISVVVSTTLTTVQKVTSDAVGSLVGEVPGQTIFWQIVNTAASLAVIFLGFALLYRFVPRCEVSMRDIWPAALITAIAWTIAKEGFAFFLGSSFANFSAVYGTLGTVITLLTWIYISSIIVLTGAEFSSETARVRDLRVKVIKAEEGGGEGVAKKKSPWLKNG